jgi:hypothetical protein
LPISGRDARANCDGHGAALLLDPNGNLKANVASGGGSGGTSLSFAATFPSTGTAAGAEYLSSAPYYTTSGQMEPLWVNSNGMLNIDAPSGSNLAKRFSSPIPQARTPSERSTCSAMRGRPSTGRRLGGSSERSAGGRGLERQARRRHSGRQLRSDQSLDDHDAARPTREWQENLRHLD